MKILLANDTYYPHVNGSSYFTQRLARYMKMRGHDIAVIAPSISIRNTKNVVDGIIIYGIWSFPILFYKKFRFCLPSLFLKRNVQNIIKEFNPDIIHIQGHFFISRTVLFAAKKYNIHIVATNHFMPENLIHYLHLPSTLSRRIHQWLWNDFASVFKNANCVTTPTHAAAALLPSLPVPIKVISNGIALDRFNPKNNGEYLKKRYHLPSKPILLYVGRLDKEKNLDLVIKVSAMVSKNVDFCFVIAGKGAEKNKLENLAERLHMKDKILFLGFVPDDDLANLYAAADCFISAGTAELQSLVTMEAMATGLPIIAVRALALPELVHHNENGFLFEDQNYQQLAKYIEKIFSDESLRKQMGGESLKIIAQHDISKTVDAFETLYHVLSTK